MTLPQTSSEMLMCVDQLRDEFVRELQQAPTHNNPDKYVAMLSIEVHGKLKKLRNHALEQGWTEKGIRDSMERTFRLLVNEGFGFKSEKDKA